MDPVGIQLTAVKSKYSRKDNVVLSPQSENAAIEVHSYGKNAQIAGSSVNYVINSYGYYHPVINSSDGDDEIFIHENGNSAKITPGQGNDKIYSSSSDMEIKYGYADDYDTIYGVNSDTTINVKSNVFSTVSSGKDIVMQFDNGSIILVNTANKSFNLISKEVSPLEKGDDVSYYYAGDNHFIENYQPNERV